jgi:hypothetical protein
MSAEPASGWFGTTAMAAAHAVTWPGACAITVIVLGILAYRLLAEHGRRKTLEATYRHALPGTVVVQDDGPGGPAMWIWVGITGNPSPNGSLRMLHREPPPERGRR